MKDFWENFGRIRNHKRTLIIFSIGLFGTLLPLIFGGLLSAGLGKWPGIAHFWEKGDFYIYSAAFASQAVGFFVLMLIDKEQKVSRYVLVILTFLALLVLVFSSIFYSSVFTSDLMKVSSLTAPFLTVTSVILLLLAAAFFYASSYLGEASIDVKQIDDDAVKEMTGKI